MRILVLGAGAVGGCFGARLAECGADVSFLVRPRWRAQLDKNGLVVRSGFGGDMVLPVTTVASGDIAAPYDLVLLACKAYDLQDAMTAIAPAMGSESVVLPLLNGLHQIDILQARFGDDRVWRGVCYIGAAFDQETGEIRHLGDFHRIIFGELDGRTSARADAFAALDAIAGFDIELSSDITQTMWDKFAMLAALASANTITRAADFGIDVARYRGRPADRRRTRYRRSGPPRCGRGDRYANITLRISGNRNP